MEKILIATSNLMKHLQRQASNYSLILGVIFISRFIYVRYGIDTLLLFIGVLLILFSFVLELGKKNVKKLR